MNGNVLCASNRRFQRFGYPQHFYPNVVTGLKADEPLSFLDAQSVGKTYKTRKAVKLQVIPLPSKPVRIDLVKDCRPQAKRRRAESA